MAARTPFSRLANTRKKTASKARATFRPEGPDERIRVQDYSALTRADDAGAKVGKAYFFKDGKIYFLLGKTLNRAFGIIDGTTTDGKNSLPKANLSMVSTVARMYRESDEVNILVVDPLNPGAEKTIIVTHNQTSDKKHRIKLNKNGVALLSVGILPSGSYTATIENDDTTTSFSVGEFVLPGLTATFATEELEGDKFTFSLKVATTGLPFNGKLDVHLLKESERTGEKKRITAEKGTTDTATFKLDEKEAEYSLEVVSADDAEKRTIVLMQKSASVQIASLTHEWEVSLIPTAGTTKSSYGMFYTPTGMNTQPFEVKEVVGSGAVITAKRDVKSLQIKSCNAHTWEVVDGREVENIKQGDTFKLKISAPFGIISIGAYLDDNEAFEASYLPAHDVAAELNVELDHLQKVRPGEQTSLRIVVNKAATAHVVVKRTQLIAFTPEQILASKTLGNMSDWADFLFTGTVTRTLEEATPQRQYLLRSFGGPMRGGRSTLDDNDTLERTTMRAMPEGVYAMATAKGLRSMEELGLAPSPQVMVGVLDRPKVEVQAATEVALPDFQTRRIDGPNILLEQLINLKAGENEVIIPACQMNDRYTIEVFTLAGQGLLWKQNKSTLTVQKPVFAEISAPLFVASGDEISGSANIKCDFGQCQVQLTDETGAVVTLYDGSNPVSPDEIVFVESGRLKKLKFQATPGFYQMFVKSLGADGEDVVEFTISPLGKMKYISDQLVILQSGEVINLADRPDIMDLKILPAITEQIELNIQAATDIQHLCCGQTACAIETGCFGLAISQNGKQGKFASSESALITRQMLMYNPNGWSFYPKQPAADLGNHYAHVATEKCAGLRKFRGLSAPKEIKDGLAELMGHGERLAPLYNVSLIPKAITNCRDAYAVLVFGKEDKHEEALNFAATALQKTAEGFVVQNGGNSWEKRIETAYAVAALFRGNRPQDREKMFGGYNWLASQIGPEGRFHGTEDSLGLATSQYEMLQAGVLKTGGGEVEINGTKMTVSHAAKNGVKIETIKSLTDGVVVKMRVRKERDWTATTATLAISAELQMNGKKTRTVHTGDEAKLVIRLLDGYFPGAFIKLQLPGNLPFFNKEAGTFVYQLERDLGGEAEIKISVVALSPGSTKFLAYASDMNNDDKMGLLEVPISVN